MRKNISKFSIFITLLLVAIVSLTACDLFPSDNISSSDGTSDSQQSSSHDNSSGTSDFGSQNSSSSEQESIYFFPQSIPYDGPRLNMDYVGATAYQRKSGKYTGTGGAFEVTLNRCIDGDTTVFYYPYEINSLFPSTSRSTRYFNMDTPETYSGGEEEWGKLASNYVCCTLNITSSILIQTDPGDNLFDHYNRLLGWIWIQVPGDSEYQLLNYSVVRQGLGNVRYLYGAGETMVTSYQGMTYTEWMWAAEAGAEMDGHGMYSNLLDYYWDYVNDRPNWIRWNESGCNW